MPTDHPALTALAVLGCLFLSLLIVDRAFLLWRNLWPDHRPGALEADHAELKAYTHNNIHKLRTDFQIMQNRIYEKAETHAERLARLEAKTDAQTESLDRLLKIAEAQLLKPAKEVPAT